MTPERTKERLAEILSQIIDVNDKKLTRLFWDIVFGNMDDGVRAEFMAILFETEEAGMDVDFQPSVDISLKPKIMRESASRQAN